jgi:hypothetical protein
VRTPEFFDARDPLWGPYLIRDIRREAESIGLPIRWPRPDPVRQTAADGYRTELPHIHRLTHLAAAAAERGRGLPFLREASRVIWSGEVDDWRPGDQLGAAPRAPASTGRNSPAPSTPIPTAMPRSSPRARPTSAPPGIGACRGWCSAASRSSARTGSTSWSGG